mgnify:CR=1 FL=1
MALETTDNRKQYAGNGVTTNFSFPYYFLSQSDLVVILKNNTTGAETIQVLTTNYTVTGAGTEAGGSITMLVAPPTGYTLIIYRDPEIIQDKDFRENDSFPAEQAEEAWDRAAMISQRLAERITRSVRVSEGFDLTDFDLTLPQDLTAVGSEGKVIIIKADLSGFEMGPTADEIADAQNQANAAAASAAAAATSESNAAGSEAAAAASAAAAAIAAASNIWRDVVFLTVADSPYTITDAQRGKMFAIDSSGGAITVNLPSIAALDLSTPFTIGMKKTSSDGNTITVNRNGTDTIDGGTTKTITVAQSGSTFIPDTDPSPDRWTTADFGVSAGNITVDSFTGDGSTTGYSLTVQPGSKNNTWVEVGGVYQRKSTYSLSGFTLTFSEAPPNGAAIEVVSGTLLTIGAPSDGTVTTAKIEDLAVTTAKIAALAITAAKIADATITSAKMALTQPTQQKFTSGSGTYTTPAGVKRIRVRMVGGGAGGGSSGSSGTATGTSGGNTTFGAATAGLATGGLPGGGVGGTGGTANLGGYTGLGVDGANGNAGGYDVNMPAGTGGSSFFGGAGPGGARGVAGVAAKTNSGSGGGGGGATASLAAGAGGGAGAFVEFEIATPSSTYSYAVGAGGGGAAAGTGGFAGAAGGAGVIVVDEYYH